MELVADWAWVFWVALILVFVTVEMLTLEFTFLMLALGSAGGLVSGLLGAPWWAQLLTAALLSVILLFALRPQLLRLLRRGETHVPSNVEALLGIGGRVVASVTELGGQVRLGNGDTWTARLAPGAPGAVLPPGTEVVVARIDGATAVVAPAGRTVV